MAQQHKVNAVSTEQDFKPPVAPVVREKVTLRSVPGLVPIFWTMMVGLACFGLLLPVVPFAVIEDSGSKSFAGMTTAVMMAFAVATQLITPRLLRRFNYRLVIVVSAALLGVPSLGYLLSMEPAMVLLFTAVRGIGFGAICVALYALVAQLAPEGTLGKASGLVGLGSGLGQMIALPLGLAITDSTLGFAGAYIVACVCGVLALVCALWVPNPQATVLDEQVEMNPQDPERVVVDSTGRLLEDTEHVVVDQAAIPTQDTFTHGPTQHRPRSVRAARLKAAARSVSKVTHLRPGRVVKRIYRRPRPDGLIVTLVPAVVLACCSLGYGSITSFLPAAVKDTGSAAGATLAGFMLAIVSGAVMSMRLVSGAVADKLQRPGALMIPAIIGASVGLFMTVAALTLGAGAWVTIVLLVLGAMLFGAGFGVIQNEAMMEMFIRMPRDKIDQASTVWNASFDVGTAVGSVILGVIAAATGYVGAFIAAGAFVAFGLIMEIGERIKTKQHER